MRSIETLTKEIETPAAEDYAFEYREKSIIVVFLETSDNQENDKTIIKLVLTSSNLQKRKIRLRPR